MRPMIGMGAALGAVMVSLAVDARAVDVELSAVPAPVMDTVKGRFKDMTVAGAAAEKTPEGQQVYEISLDNKGKNVDLALTPEGTLLSIDREITRKELPAPVLATLDKDFAKNRTRMVEERTEVKDGTEAFAYYDVLLMNADKQLRSVQLSADGKVLAVEKKGDESAEE